uniref:RNA-dependent RNA polymerase n=1 Tax=Haemonchus contortus TaxID=6289 RepID=A0A7I4XVN9_HAECO
PRVVRTCSGTVQPSEYVPSFEDIVSANFINVALDAYLNIYRLAKARDLLFVRAVMKMKISRFPVDHVEGPCAAEKIRDCFNARKNVRCGYPERGDDTQSTIVDNKGETMTSGRDMNIEIFRFCSARKELGDVIARTFTWRSPHSIKEHFDDMRYN